MLAVSEVKLPTGPKTFPQGITELHVHREMLAIIHFRVLSFPCAILGKKREKKVKSSFYASGV